MHERGAAPVGNYAVFRLKLQSARLSVSLFPSMENCPGGLYCAAMDQLSQAVDLLRSGGLVAFPTETVYGLGCDATNSRAVRQLFQVKGRPFNNPLIVHVADALVGHRYVREWPETASVLARCFWPGPLTLVLPKAPCIVPEVTAGLDTVGLRCPNHPLTLELLRRFDGPVAGPSANRSSRVSPTTAEHVRQELGDAPVLILDGGPCSVGIESTVLDLCSSPPRILRPGGLSQHEIEREIGPVHVLRCSVAPEAPALSPGLGQRHYSPNAAAYRFAPEQAAEVLRWSREHPGQSWGILAMEPLRAEVFQLLQLADAGAGPARRVVVMPSSADEYARRLYATLRALDADDLQVIFIQMPPDEPAFAAVRDRIIRATEPL